VEIGPYCIIGENVSIDRGCRLNSGVVIEGWTQIGKNNLISHGAVIGTEPQDIKYKNEETYVKIGDGNIIREFVTIHRAATKGHATIIGNFNMLMAYVHVAHNCILGNEITIANSVGLSGHVEVEDQAVIGGMAGIHQFVKIGRLAMVGGFSKVTKDIPPFAIVDGQPARLYGINFRGMRRRNIGSEIRSDIKTAFKIMSDSGLSLSESIKKIKKTLKSSPELNHLIHFLENPSRMGILFRNIPSSRIKDFDEE